VNDAISENGNGIGSGRRIVILGGRRLSGVVPIGGSKNAAVALMAGALLAETGETVLTNVPRISDIETLSELFCRMGARVTFEGDGHTVRINATGLNEHEAPADLVARMRASFWVLGPVLARLGKAVIPQPGGCNIGARAVDLHLKGMELLGATVRSEHGAIRADAPVGGLRGANIYLDLPSVGASMNIMMAATLAKGTTIIQNAAQEPDVENLGDLLAAMGADIKGQGTGTIIINGVERLHGATFAVMPDRIEAGTFAAAAAITGGDVLLKGANPAHLRPVTFKLAEMGVGIDETPEGVRIRGKEAGRLQETRLTAMPHPGFPTDLQQPFTSLLSVAQGTSIVTDTVYESRFHYLTELAKLGARVNADGGRSAIVTGVERLSGATVRATDLRAGAALIVAALAAEGETRVYDTYHVERGYEDIVGKLCGIGAELWREDNDGHRYEDRRRHDGGEI